MDAIVVEPSLSPLLLVLSGAFVGMFVGMTGVGGGALMTPILVLGFGISPVTAVATDLAFAAITKCATSIVHFRSKNVDTRVLWRLWSGSIPACIVVGVLVGMGWLGNWNQYLLTPMAVMIALSGLSLLLARRVQSRRTEKRLANPESFKRGQTPLTVCAGIGLGAIVAATSIGAGAIGAALLRALYPLRMTPIRLVATDTVHAIPVALIAGGTYAALGQTNWGLLLWLLVGSLPVAVIASVVVSRLSPSWVRGLLGVTLLVLAAKMLLA